MWREENVYKEEKIISIHGEGTSQVSIPEQIGESGMPNHLTILSGSIQFNCRYGSASNYFLTILFLLAFPYSILFNR